MNEGSIGCSFLVPPMNMSITEGGSCHAFFVSNNWSSPVTLHLEFAGRDLSLDGAVWVPYVEEGVLKHKKLEGPIPPESGAVVFVSKAKDSSAQKHWVDCPEGVVPALDDLNTIDGSAFGSASFMTTDVPVSIYSIYPYGGASSVKPSATLLLPTSSFRKNYVAASAWGGLNYGWGRGVLPNSSPGATPSGVPTLQVAAIEDGTSVSLLTKVDIGGRPGGILDTPRNSVVSYELNRGEVLQIAQGEELTGSALESTKPVAVFGGHTGMLVPSDILAADAEHFQVPPVSAWGNEYAVIPAPNRVNLVEQKQGRARDPSVTRIVAAVDGTELVYEPYPPEGAPHALRSGEFAAFYTDAPFVVRSQDSDHPIFLMNVMTGANASSTTLGDPEVSVPVPTQQWLDDYRFFSDTTYQLSAAFVARRRSGGVFHDVELDCAGALANWTPIGDDFEWTYVELTRHSKPQTYPAGTCADGPHRIRSDGPFTFSVWGLSYYASYEYTGGTGLRPLTEITIPAVK